VDERRKRGADGDVQAFIRDQESEWFDFSRTRAWLWYESCGASIVQCATKVIDICEQMHVLMDPEQVY